VRKRSTKLMFLRANPILTHFGGVVNSYFAFFGEIWGNPEQVSRPGPRSIC